ncbi:2270_t:CDS:1, partial [Funneliformis geosporum]
DPYLELDQNKLKKATALHFQTVAGSLNKEVTDPTTLTFQISGPIGRILS